MTKTINNRKNMTTQELKLYQVEWFLGPLFLLALLLQN